MSQPLASPCSFWPSSFSARWSPIPSLEVTDHATCRRGSRPMTSRLIAVGKVEPTPPITGADGELIERFLAALEREPSGAKLWSSKLALIIAGQLDGPLGSLHLDVGINDDAEMLAVTRGTQVRRSRDIPR